MSEIRKLFVDMANPAALCTKRNPDAYRGQCELSVHYDNTGSWLEVVRADPRILVTDELLYTLHESPHRRELRLDMPARQSTNQTPTEPPAVPADLSGFVDLGHIDGDGIKLRPPPGIYEDALLHIDARNRKLIYRIGQHRPLINAWEAAWPD